MAEKTEKASPRKLRKAIEQGDVPKAQDFTSAVSFAAGYFLMVFISSFMIRQLVTFFYFAFNVENYLNKLFTYHGINKAFCLNMCQEALLTSAKISVPIVIAVIFASITATIIVSGTNFSMQALEFKLSRFNFINNIKSRFSKDSLVSIVKQIITSSIVAFVIYKTISREDNLVSIVFCFTQNINGIVTTIIKIMDEVIKKVILITLIIGIVDATYQLWSYYNKLMMDKQEAKQDYKESEGNPETKSKQKEFSKELVYSESPTQAAKKATLLVTNPTHIAISVLYNIDEHPVPIITGKGSDNIALQMIDIGKDNNVKIHNNPDLAWQLFDIEVNEEVPVETFEALAQVLQTIASVREKIHT